jgi:pantoate--beta-alanine ligase
MRRLFTPAEVRAWRAERGGTVGFVPTMGFLHEGHLALMRQAKVENDAAAASLFVNPLQFGPGEDFGRYPRALEADLAKLESAGVDAVFTPAVEALYPPGFDARVEVGGVTAPLEGAVRPGHFTGVATVVLKLFNIVGPDRAYFGQKDAQQCVVIRKMVRDLDVPVEVVVAPTVREADGLAISSRNTYLGPEERAAATVLIRALWAAEAAFRAGERDAEALRRRIAAVLAAQPLARPDYVSLANPETLAEVQGLAGEGALASLAVRIGTTRLIDNLVLRSG